MTHYDNALHMMELQGGSFVKALAHCYYMADSDNKRTLRDAFAKYFDEYEKRFTEYASTIRRNAIDQVCGKRQLEGMS